MAKAQQIVSSSIVNLSSMVELRLVDILQDGRASERSTLYVVDVRTKTDGRRPGRTTGRCILKVFPDKQKEAFRHEVEAYTRLMGHVSYASAQEAADGLFHTLSQLKPKSGWPQCLGYMAVPVDLEVYEFAWTDMAQAGGRSQNALLLEYISDLEPVNLKRLDEELIEDILSVLAQLQEQGIHHRVNTDPSVWPNPGVRNIYVRHTKPGARLVPFISNFGNAMLLGDSKREQRMMEAEMEDLEHHLRRGMAGKMLVDEHQAFLMISHYMVSVSVRLWKGKGPISGTQRPGQPVDSWGGLRAVTTDQPRLAGAQLPQAPLSLAVDVSSSTIAVAGDAPVHSSSSPSACCLGFYHSARTLYPPVGASKPFDFIYEPINNQRNPCPQKPASQRPPQPPAMAVFNIFRILGDLSHMASKAILIFAIHSNRSAEGVSLITQILYALVFCTRYLNFFGDHFLWNILFKTAYILTSFYTLGIMQWVFPRSRERELSWKLGAIILGGAAALSPFVMLIFVDKKGWGFLKWMWTFSEILESVCVLPQLLLLRQTTVPTVIDSFYLVALGSYRALYCLNWFVRSFDKNPPDAISVIFGIIQTALYADFAWVYYTRQRVKLRGGGVVDADDLRRGVLVQRIFGRTLGSNNEEHDEEAGLHQDEQRGSRPKWGSRGISVSADEGIFEDEERGEGSEGLGGAVDPDAKMRDPDDLAKALDDEEDDDEDAPLRPGQSSGVTPAGMRSGDEWRD